MELGLEEGDVLDSRDGIGHGTDKGILHRKYDCMECELEQDVKLGLIDGKELCRDELKPFGIWYSGRPRMKKAILIDRIDGIELEIDYPKNSWHKWWYGKW